MRVLLDTNIVLDYLGANKGFTKLFKVLISGQMGQAFDP